MTQHKREYARFTQLTDQMDYSFENPIFTHFSYATQSISVCPYM